jgi:hypothetical protein
VTTSVRPLLLPAMRLAQRALLLLASWLQRAPWVEMDLLLH